MKETDQKIWIGDWDLSGDSEFAKESHKEFSSDLPIVDSFGDNRSLGVQSSRRDFLKYLGFGLGAATVAASCEIPLKRAIPYVVKPDDIVPGVANFYASSFVHGGDYCSVLVKTREGRPIKIEGNDLSGVTKGGTSARAQAVVLSLYDRNRFRSPMRRTADGDTAITWEELDTEITGKLDASSQVRFLTGTILSPTAKRVLDEFKAKFPNTEVVSYDPVSSAALLKANEQCFGVKAVPDYHFDKAKVIVGIQADFLGTWISPVEYAKDYIVNRRIDDPRHPRMSRHYQVESYFSLTGSKADNRIQIRPSEAGAAVAHLYNAVASAVGAATISAPALNDAAKSAIEKAGRMLAANRGESLVVCGTNNIGEQVIVNSINDLLGNYGHTLDFGAVNNLRQGDESGVQKLLADISGNRVNALFVWGANPVFDLPNGQEVAEAISSVPLTVSFALLDDETSAACKYVAPTHHLLESWGDAEPKKGHYSLIQPTISPLFKTRQVEETLLRWCGSSNINTNSDQPYYEYLMSAWKSEMATSAGASDPEAFWQKALHDGIYEMPVQPAAVSFAGDVNAAASKITRPGGEGIEMTFYETVNLGAGQYANNPWLMEMPDPVTRCSWGNYLGIPLTWDGVRRFNGLNGLEDGHLTTVTIGSESFTVPVVKQFGQHENTLALALGYGRSRAGRCGTGVGVNVQPFLSYDADGMLQYFAGNVSLTESQGKEDHFSCVQYHHTMGVKGIDKATQEEINADEAATVYTTYFGLAKQGFQGSLVERTVIRRAHLDDIEQFIHDLQHEREHFEYLNEQTLYPDYSERFENGHHWGMHVDLNACIGCGACTVACMAENNVPIVGKKEVSRHHEMTWLRIDRYYYGDVENPNVVYQPLMCQHCDNAPCENVCPVNATNQSSEGINQMAYNRCVGTRYCANNCPYKVRRFNWLDYNAADLWPANERGIDYEDTDVPWSADNLTRMVLNPDVTVRARGVMEKCSFCMQRIQAGKLEAKQDGRALRDADVRTACQTACPTGAITFGDQNNKTGDLGKKWESPLNYEVLEEVNTRPVVRYQALINNRDLEV